MSEELTKTTSAEATSEPGVLEPEASREVASPQTARPERDGADGPMEPPQRQKKPRGKPRWSVWFDRVGYAALLGVFVMSFVYKSTPMSGTIWCHFRKTTTFPCPGCGLTRSFVAMSEGNLAEALWVHFGGPMLYIAMVYILIVGALRWTTRGRWPTRGERWRKVTDAYWWVFAALFIVNAVTKVALRLREILEIT